LVHTTPSRSPDAPAGFSAVRGDVQVSLSWTAPADNGGSPITGYAISIGTTSGGEVYLTSVNGTTFTVTGLTNGQVYYFIVAAVNVRGNGTIAAEACAMPATVPGMPSGLVVVAGPDNVTLSWSAPTNDGGSPVTTYTIHRSTGGVEIGFDSLGTSAVDRAVTHGVAYTYRIVANNIIGVGASSPSSDSVVPGAAPSSVMGMHAIAGIGNVTLSWSAPADNGGLAVSAYKVLRGPSLTTVVQIATIVAPGYLDATAESGKTYCYLVVAVNAKGDGAVASVNATSLNQPAQPSSVTVTRQGSGALISWSEDLGDPNASSVTGYAIYRQSGSGWELVGTVNGTSVSNYTDIDVPSGAVQYKVVPMSGNGIADINSAGSSSGGSLAAADKGMDLTLPALAATGVVALLLVLFLAGKRRKKEGQ